MTDDEPSTDQPTSDEASEPGEPGGGAEPDAH